MRLMGGFCLSRVTKWLCWANFEFGLDMMNYANANIINLTYNVGGAFTILWILLRLIFQFINQFYLRLPAMHCFYAML